jgi:tryptophan synthase alpha chain
MGRIDNAFRKTREQGRAAFIAYITAGDPSLESTRRLIQAFERKGVDIVELGVPFSDPIADGPVNQEAAMRAIKSGTTIEGILEMIRGLRKVSQIPILFFMYYNSLLAYGLERFAGDASSAGLDGALALDLPPEEAGEYKRLMDGRGLSTVFLVSPVTPPDRMELIAKHATGFIYYVSQLGVTGERAAVAAGMNEKLRQIRKQAAAPVAVGFGISRPEHVRSVAACADGVIVGSSIVRKIGELGGKPGFEEEVAEFVGELTEPLKGTGDG